MAPSKNNPLSTAQLQRVIVRQSEGTDLQLISPPRQIKNHTNTTKIIQPSIQPATQTKMISAAELQKLISSGAVKTVTRTSNISQTPTTIPSPSIIRQASVQEKPQSQAQQQV